MDNFLKNNKEFFNNDTKIALYKLGYITRKVMDTMTPDDRCNFSIKFLKSLNPSQFKREWIIKKLYPAITFEINKNNLRYEWMLTDISEIIINTELNELQNDGIENETMYFTMGFNELGKEDIEGVISFKEASEKWCINSSTLRKLTTTDKLVEGVDFKKSGGTWLITREAMKRIYGEEKNK